MVVFFEKEEMYALIAIAGKGLIGMAQSLNGSETPESIRMLANAGLSYRRLLDESEKNAKKDEAGQPTNE